MSNLKHRIIGYMSIVSLVTLAVLLIFFVIFQVFNEQNYAKANASEMFYQIEQILNKNKEELVEIQEEYNETILRRADNIAYILQNDPESMWDQEELKHIAEMVGVDEIHLFDTTGEIVSGTVPKYYGYTFDSGEQMAFFKPLLTDKSLRLVQEITPNTADEKLMQYSAIWSNNGGFIVQVGMEPVNVTKMTEKNELSYIFSLLHANKGVHLYAADPESGQIEGATSQESIGKTLYEIGINREIALTKKNGFHASIDGDTSFCIFTNIDDTLVGYVVSHKTLYENILNNSFVMIIGLILVAILLVVAVTFYMEKYVIRSVSKTNEMLREITEGDLEKTVDIRSSLEFSELSDHINDMVKSLLSSTQKMSDVLHRADINMGVYEYNTHMQHVRFTEHVPKILALDIAEDGSNRLAALDKDEFREHIKTLTGNPLQDEEGVYCLNSGDQQRFIKLEEIVENHETTGIVMDISDEVNRRKEIETERDIDQLTGILNRRGLDNALARLFQDSAEIRHSAVIMIDADGLKTINDSFGHDNGDIYIKAIADSLSRFGKEHCPKYIASRNGGDEFVLFLYEYDSDEQLLKSIRELEDLQDKESIRLNNGQSVPLRFSMGYSIRTDEVSYYGDLFKSADQRMYENKRRRKEQL